jgi:hypothetical protein
MEIAETVEIHAPADRGWAIAGAFDGLDRWVPGVEDLRCAGSGPGSIRRFAVNGHEMEERQTARDEAARSYSYTITRGPVPVTGYCATLSVIPLSPDRSVVQWAARFEPDGIDADACEWLLRRSYRAGLENLRRLLEGEGRAAAAD